MGKGGFTCTIGQAESSVLHPGLSPKGWVCSRLSFSSFVVAQRSESGGGGAAFGGFVPVRLGFDGEEQQQDTVMAMGYYSQCGHGKEHRLMGYGMVLIPLCELMGRCAHLVHKILLLEIPNAGVFSLPVLH